MPDLVAELARCAEALTAPAGPAALHAEVDHAVKRLVGHKLLTLLVVVEGGEFVERIYSSNPTAYPVTGRKPMNRTAWGDTVIRGLKPWHGRTMADLRWAFGDHELIASLGCGCCINIPVIRFGTVIGTMNVLDAENAYADATVETLKLFAPVLALPFAEAARAIDGRA
jgi:hypothetical protein